MKKEKLDVTPGKIHQTTNYSLFKFDDRNRKISEKHRDSLITNMTEKNLLKDNPILIDSEGTILGGQHRFEAARAIGAPIYYMVSQEMTVDDIVKISTSHKDWALRDRLDSYVAAGNRHYIEFKRFIEAAPEFPVNSAQILVGGIRAKTRDFNAGRFEVGDVDKGLEVATFILKLRKWMNAPTKADKFFRDRGFVLAMYQAYNSPGFSPDEFEKKVTKKWHFFEKQTSPKKYRIMINNILGKRLLSEI